MYKNFRVAVIIPVYCEEDRVRNVLNGLPSWVDHVVVVDDASADRTAEVVGSIEDKRCVLLRHEKNQGVGAATLTGWRKALELGADILVKMDGDGQMDPSALATLIAPLAEGKADYAKGNRFLHAMALTRMPWIRRFGNIGLSFMAKLASGYWSVFDPTNGYVAIHAAVMSLLDENRIHKRFFFEHSLLLELGLHRAVVCDVYMPARYGDKVSSLSEQRSLIEFPPLLVKGCCRRWRIQYFVRDFSDVSLLLLIGTAATAFGTTWGIYHWYAAASQRVTASTGTVMIAVLPIVLGLQFLLQALIADIQRAPREPLHLTQLPRRH
jgi:glycosyltransferase involved in cell wall biosynthesis